MKKLSLLFALLSSWNLHAQTYEWTNAIGGAENSDLSYSVLTDADGNVYIAGSCYNDSVDFDPSPATDFLYAPGTWGLIGFIAKYDASGNLVWARNTGQHEINSMDIDQNANIYITGNFLDSTDVDPTLSSNYLYGNGQSDIYLIKYDSAGNFLWGNAFGNTGSDYGLDVHADHSGNVCITGYYYSSSIDFDPSASINNIISYGGSDAFLAKYDALGNYLWAITIGGPNGDVGKSIAFNQSDQVYITGGFFSTADFDPSPATAILNTVGAADIFIATYDLSGNYISAKNIGNATSGENAYIEFDATNNLLITGHYNGTVDFDPGPGTYNLTSSGAADIYFGKYTSSLNLIFVKQIGGSSDDRGLEIKADTSGNIYLGGYFKNTIDFDPGPGIANATAIGISHDLFVSKYSPIGNFIWAKSTGGSGEDLCQSIAVNSNGDVYLTGSFENTVDFNPGLADDSHTSNGMEDIFLTKYSNPTTGIYANKDIEEISFKIYPNPTNGLLFCEVSENTTICIYNTLGEQIYSYNLNRGKHNLDISHLLNGVYFVEDSVSTSIMIIKQ